MVVIDASALIEYLLDAEAYPRIEQIVRTESMHAPHLIDVEVVHALRHAVLGHRLDVARAGVAIEDFMALSIERYGHDRFLARMLALRNNVSAYDATYVALAETLDATLITRDAALARSSGHAARIEYID